ncbi:hypothetical protein [Paenibacillus sp. FSL H8-0079]|uniref:hypothetical protein n=1 Tax=Paenibacillus sp. FSL H8-0079 TaxID=2921375 RepID=UPI0030EE2166
MNSFLIIGVLILLIVITILVEIQRFKVLKLNIEKNLPSGALKSNVVSQEDIKLLLRAYRTLQTNDSQKLKVARIYLKILKEKQSDNSPFEDIIKLITIFITLVGLMITTTLKIPKETIELLSIIKPISEIVLLLMLIVSSVIFISYIFKFSTNRSTELINIHIVASDEITSDSELVINDITPENLNQDNAGIASSS